MHAGAETIQDRRAVFGPGQHGDAGLRIDFTQRVQRPAALHAGHEQIDQQQLDRRLRELLQRLVERRCLAERPIWMSVTHEHDQALPQEGMIVGYQNAHVRSLQRWHHRNDTLPAERRPIGQFGT